MNGTLRVTFVRFAIVGIGVLLWSGCSGSTPVTPTPTLTITCPASASARAAIGSTTVPVTFASPVATGGKAPLTTSCSQSSGASFPVGSTTVTCNAGDTAGHAASCTFSVTVDAAPVPKLLYTKYLAFGDSETEGKVSTVPMTLLPNSYTLKLQPMLQAHYPAQTFVVGDEGQGGQPAADPATITRFDTALTVNAPEVVLIMDGANDLNGQVNAGIVPAIAAIGTLGAHAAAKGVQVFIATLPPMDPTKKNGGGAPALPAYNAQLVSLAASHNWTLVDVNAAFHGDLGLIGSDGLHPTDAGYQVIAQAFYDKIVALYDRTPAALR